MDTAEYVEEVRRAGHRLADIAEDQLERPVPSCPDWTVAELVDHMADVIDFWGAIASGRAASPDAYVRPPTPGRDELVGWYRGLLDTAIAELGTVDPATPRWNWTGDEQNAAWIIRRMANETAVHCWDGEAAVDDAQPLRQPIALDGIDEFFDVFAPLWAPELGGPVSTVHLHATDGPGEWFATVGRRRAPGRAGARQGRCGRARDGVGPRPHALEPGRSRPARAARRPGRARSVPGHRQDRLT